MLRDRYGRFQRDRRGVTGGLERLPPGESPWHPPCTDDLPMPTTPYVDDDASEVQSLQLKLRLAADPATSAYQVSIELSEVDVVVEVLDVDLRRAIRTAAEKCAAQLRDHGYSVTVGEVIGALEEALENSELVQRSAQPLN